MNCTSADAIWEFCKQNVTDRMKVITRPHVAIMAGTKIGTGTFIEKDGVKVLTCAHVADCQPHAHYVDDGGSTEIQPGIWCADPGPAVDAAFAPIDAGQWSKIASTAQPVSMSRFAARHDPVPDELLFFRGIAGENVAYISGLGADVILTGYCSQEIRQSGDANVFEMFWEAGKTTVTQGTDHEVRDRVKYDDPAGFSGSLVWNTRFVESGCDLGTWSPNDAVVTGLLRRYDVDAGSLLAWRVEHLLKWLA